MLDSHAGPRDWQLQMQPPGGGFVSLCPLRDAASDLSCDWNTSQVADGTYSLRGEMRDLLSSPLGGPNSGFTATISTIVDNTPAQIGGSGDLWDSQDGRPLNTVNSYGLAAYAQDATSGAVRLKLDIDATTAAEGAAGQCGHDLCLSYDLDASRLTDGPHTVTLSAEDRAGNESSQSWTIDVESPAPVPDDEPVVLDDDGSGSTTSANQFNASVSAPAQTSPTPSPENYLPCSTDAAIGFPVWTLGASFETLPRVDSSRRCDVPAPLQPFRVNAVFQEYGACTEDPTADPSGCLAPLEVQSWPACERSLFAYETGPEDMRLPYDVQRLRGAVSAVFEDGHRIEIYTGLSTVVIYGANTAQVSRAANAVQQAAGLTLGGGPLPQPIVGAIEGDLSCSTQLSLSTDNVRLTAALPTAPVTLPVSTASLPQRYNGDVYATKASTNCDPATAHDPVGVVFQGSAAKAGVLGSFDGGRYFTGDIEFHTNWIRAAREPQSYMNYGRCKGINDAQQSSRDYDERSDFALRNHIRIWEQWDARYRTVGTPHVDSSTPRCGRDHVPSNMRLPGGGTGSGYDYARERLVQIYRSARAHFHPAESSYWGNVRPASQCGLYRTAGSGTVWLIQVGR